ncbi:hypothetical protein YC2023_027608 [Brassica napus]
MSGKALGGHKRIHVLENQNKSGESEIDCSVCHKKFTSRKALYGHMRFHPHRTWKGVLPPPPPPHPLGGGAREKHVCVTCNKSFTSYQALGGHRASHNKVKVLESHQARANSEALLLGTEAMITGLASAQASNTSLSSGNNGDHVCDICHKSFPTGQALGGHKRRHWTGPVSSEAVTAAPTAPAAASSSQVTETVQEVKKFEFDLNELPPNEG